eukprot:9154594-Alexandrium_andersonii.AAC.1
MHHGMLARSADVLAVGWVAAGCEVLELRALTSDVWPGCCVVGGLDPCRETSEVILQLADVALERCLDGD